MKILVVLAIFLVASRVIVSGTETILRGGRCRTLCEAGLGGKPCGCPAQIVKTRLNNEMNAWRIAHPDEHIIKGPRRELCNSLCPQGLGEPLCQCSSEITNDSGMQQPKDWCPLCRDILLQEKSPKLWLELQCHENELQFLCWNSTERKEIRKRRQEAASNIKSIHLENISKITKPQSNLLIDINDKLDHMSSRDESEEEVDWNLWCEVQCDENNGGLACNCDMLPLSIS